MRELCLYYSSANLYVTADMLSTCYFCEPHQNSRRKLLLIQFDVIVALVDLIKSLLHAYDKEYTPFTVKVRFWGYFIYMCSDISLNFIFYNAVGHFLLFNNFLQD